MPEQTVSCYVRRKGVYLIPEQMDAKGALCYVRANGYYVISELCKSKRGNIISWKIAISSGI